MSVTNRKCQTNSHVEEVYSLRLAASELDASTPKIKPKVKKYKPHFRKLAKFEPYTIFDSPKWANSEFYGFYVLFWITIFTFNARILLMNYLEHGELLKTHIIQTLISRCWHVALVDFAMYLLIYPTYYFQKLVAGGFVDWMKWGWIVQHVYQTLYLAFFVRYARAHDFPWIGQIFLALHALVQMMKMHSFAVYNGYMKHLEGQIARSSPTEGIDSELINEAKHELSIYPQNVTLKNFFMYTMFPTVVYEVEYPRTEKIRWNYAAKKIGATLGIFMCMIVISQQMLYPVVLQANELRQNESVKFRLERYPLIFLEMFPPFMLLYILTFYLIWDAILNAIAELTRFGDREFYRDWWNSTEWAKFARDWNVPVHNFLQRHVYTSTRLFLQLSKTQAILFTFLFSSMVHELAMWVIFGRLRGYLMLMQLTQLPMQFTGQLSFFKKRPTLGLIFFWFGVAVGPSILCSLYVTF